MRAGNPRWGRPMILSSSPAVASVFDETVRALGLMPWQYADSVPLKDWVKKNKNQKYVPPELLALWGFEVKAEF